jgi:hypothetical protein
MGCGASVFYFLELAFAETIYFAAAEMINMVKIKLPVVFLLSFNFVIFDTEKCPYGRLR